MKIYGAAFAVLALCTAGGLMLAHAENSRDRKPASQSSVQPIGSIQPLTPSNQAIMPPTAPVIPSTQPAMPATDSVTIPPPQTAAPTGNQ